MAKTFILPEQNFGTRLKQFFCSHRWGKWGKNLTHEVGGEMRLRCCQKCFMAQTLVTIPHSLEKFIREHGENSLDVAKRMLDNDDDMR